MKKKWIYFALGSILIAGASAGTTVGIILPKALKLKKSLGNFISISPGEDPYKYFGSKKLYYVSLGDSISSGTNLALKKDSYSFADFLANNLKNCNRLAGYKNFSITSQKIPNLVFNTFGNTSKMHAIKKADIISISIGANDLLVVSKLLEMGNVFNFNSESLNFDKELDNMLENFLDNKNENIERKNANINKGIYDKKEVDGKKYKVGDTISPLNKGEKYFVIRKSIHKFVKMYKKKDFHNIVTLQFAWKDQIFDLIKRNIMSLIRDVHALNSKAKILFVSPFFPFPQLPEKDMNKKHEDIGMSILEVFNKLISSIKEAAEFSIEGKNNFVDFIDINKLKISKSTLNKTDSRDQKNKYFKNYIKKQTEYSKVEKGEGIVPNYWKRNAFPNSFDIHPSIFGHQLIGNAIFSKIYKHLNIKNKKSEDFYTYTKPYNKSLKKQDPWTRLDEAPSAFNIDVQYFLTNLYKGKGNFIYSGIKIFEFFFTKDKFKDVIDKLNVYLLELKKLKYDDYVLILEILDDDKMIDIIIAFLDNIKEIQTLAKIAGNKNIPPANKEKTLDKIKLMINVITKSENATLWFKLQKNLNEFKKRTKNEKSEKLFRFIFEFLVKPSLSSATNLVYLVDK